ncbi:ABC transporter permease [Clostridium lundense]|uniref:ABC transporter permease n=1 Tax=Clostridium lundense TaxID=319475 RepID=UPI0004884D8A|nr:ABC transporter permease [Clostridium lundense]
MELFKSEFERIWKRKLTWICFILIPLAIAGASKYYLNNNYKHIIQSPEFVSFGNYPFMMFQEVLITLFNILTILFVCTSITEEYRNGEIRLVMIRGYSFKEIFFSKIASIVTTLGIFFITFFIMSTVVGYFAAPKLDKVMLFYHKNPVGISEALIYSAKYYAVGFVTTIAILSMFTFFAVKCKTVTGVAGVSISTIIAGGIFSSTIIYFTNLIGKELTIRLWLLTIVKIQHEGICLLLSEDFIYSSWIIMVLILHIVIFGVLSCNTFCREDHFI